MAGTANLVLCFLWALGQTVVSLLLSSTNRFLSFLVYVLKLEYFCFPRSVAGFCGFVLGLDSFIPLDKLAIEVLMISWCLFKSKYFSQTNTVKFIGNRTQFLMVYRCEFLTSCEVPIDVFVIQPNFPLITWHQLIYFLFKSENSFLPQVCLVLHLPAGKAQGSRCYLFLWNRQFNF